MSKSEQKGGHGRLLAKGNEYFRNKEFDKAIDTYELALSQHPKLRDVISINLMLAKRRLNAVASVTRGRPKLLKPKSLATYYFEKIEESGLFDSAWYLSQYASIHKSIINPLEHYLEIGSKKGLNPSPFFDTSYYIQRNPDLKDSKLHPFIHYVCQGAKEGRSALPPHPQVNSLKYPVGAPEYVPRLPPDLPPVEKAVRVIAFYLPQFHAIPENDIWWGQGFTEWTNVKPAQPQFEGHYQPHVPDEYLGYYNLTDGSTQRKQVELAKQYGIEGFCFYLYWFTGHKLLQQPVDNYLADPSLDLPFCVCWANENWSRRWDGRDQDLLMEQHYSAEDDIAFIINAAKYLRDPRYIRIDGKPLLLVYRPKLFPDVKATSKRWRDWCRENDIGEIYLAYTQSFEAVDPAKYGFDAACEFPPNNSAPPDITRQVIPQAKEFDTAVYDWRVFLERSEHYTNPGYTLFRGATPAWDNTARKKNKGTVFHNSCPQLFEKWLTNAFIDTLDRKSSLDEKIVFINAWNEWAEGAHLEPDTRYGFAWLKAVWQAHKNALGKRSRIVVVSHDAHPHGAQILCLYLAKYFNEYFKFEVHLIVLGTGLLIPKYSQYARVHQLNLLTDAPRKISSLLAGLRQTGAELAIANTTVSGKLVPYLKAAGFNVLSLIHELPGILKSYSLQEHASLIAQHADKIVFPAEQVRKRFEEFIGWPLEQSSIRPQGSYRRSPLQSGAQKMQVRAEVRNKLGVSATAKLVMCAGYADHRKGFDLFVDASIEVMKEISDCYAVWVGHHDQKVVETSLKIAEKKGFRDKFIMAGRVDAPEEYYVAADVYLLTSREDPFPTVVLEALDALTPVVAFRDCGGFESLLERGCGVLVERENVTAMAAEVSKLLRDAGRSTSLARTGRRIIKNEFNFLAYLYDLLDLARRQIPRVSVIVPNYRYEKYIRQRLETILAQTFPVYELIILDDCSPDQSVSIIKEVLKNCEIPYRLVVNNENSGSPIKQLIKGVGLARGDLVWIAEADDLAKPTLLKHLVPIFEDPEIVLAYSQSSQINEDDIVTANDYRQYTRDIGSYWDSDYIIDGKAEIRRALCIKNTILNVSAVLFKRAALVAALKAHGQELMNYKVAADWHLYIRLAMMGKIGFIAESLNSHRRHNGSVTRTHSHYAEIVEAQALAARMIQLGSEEENSAAKYRNELHLRLARA
jgi:glycosyltransferase involved in cell wall biosynthesis